jgi:hypothetical protein
MSGLQSFPSTLSTLSSLGLPSPSSSPALEAEDATAVAQRLEEVRAQLSALSPSLHSDFLLSQLHSAYSAQLRSNREAEHWQATSLQQRHRGEEMRSKCQKVQQRLQRFLAEADDLQADVWNLQAGLTGLEGEGNNVRLNGKDEKEPNGHLHPRPHPSQRSTTSSLSSRPRVPDSGPTFSALSDFSTLLAATEAQLEVERRQRERTQPSTSSTDIPPSFIPSHTLPLSLSAPVPSPYYHHDRTLTAAGKRVVRSLFVLFASSPSSTSLSFPQLQALSERVGRGESASGSSDDSGDLWWVWQSHASEDEGGEMGLTEEDLQSLYEQEWNLDEDAAKMHIN